MGANQRGYSLIEWLILIAVAAIATVTLFGLRSCMDGSEEKTSDSGPPAVVRNSEWDASVRQVKDYVLKNAHNPNSVEFVEWSAVQEGTDGTFFVRAKFRATNGFGGVVTQNMTFRLSSDGAVIAVQAVE